MDIIKNYQHNCEAWNSLHAEQQNNDREYDKKIWDVKDKYQEQISEIERKMYSEIQVVEEEKEKKINEIKKEKDIFSQKINEAKKVFKYIRLHAQGFKVETPTVYTSSIYQKRVNYNPIATIREDKYCKAYLYIVPNDKPVNKYSLIIVGSCPILEPDMDTMNPLHSYGIRAHTEERCHIMLNVKDEYSEEILQEYVQKNLKRITNKISTVDEKIALYEQAVEAFKSPEGKIAFYEWMKYYYENNYSNGTATPEYKAVLKKLKQLKG